MKKILVVDDEENIRKLYKEELEDLGYAVTTVEDGSQALDVMKTTRFDLVTLDMRMKDVDGIETLRRMKEMDSALPVIISTGPDGRLVIEVEGRRQVIDAPDGDSHSSARGRSLAGPE